MSDNFLVQLLPKTQIEEQRYLNFIFKNPSEVYLIPEYYFFNKNSKIILNSIKKILEKGLEFSIDELFYFCKLENSDFEEKIISDIQTKSVDNIEHVKSLLKENFLKYNTILKLEDVLIQSTSKGNISFKNLSKKINELYYSINDLEDVNLKTGKQLVENYLKTIEKRKQGEIKRTLGYKILDELIVKPAAPEQMTAIVGMTGGSKTTFAKNIEMKCLSKGIPVVSINLENSEEDCMDLNTCIRMNLPLEELLKKDINPRLETKIKKDMEYFENIPNYLFYSEPELTLNQLDGLLYQSKYIFKDNKVLSKDEDYMFVIIDLTEMITEYSEAKNPYEIKNVLTILLQICRKHKCHFLLLIQSSENKIRGGKIFKNSDELDYYKIGLEDIEGSASISKRCRVVMTLTRPIQMKKRFFPEEKERWDLEVDVINCNIVKQNAGPEGFTKFILTNTFRIYQYNENELKEE